MAVLFDTIIIVDSKNYSHILTKHTIVVEGNMYYTKRNI